MSPVDYCTVNTPVSLLFVSSLQNSCFLCMRVLAILLGTCCDISCVSLLWAKLNLGLRFCCICKGLMSAALTWPFQRHFRQCYGLLIREVSLSSVMSWKCFLPTSLIFLICFFAKIFIVMQLNFCTLSHVWAHSTFSPLLFSSGVSIS